MDPSSAERYVAFLFTHLLILPPWWLTGLERAVYSCGRIGGEEEKAINALDQVMALPYYRTVALFRVGPLWDPLRHHPCFRVLLEKYADDVEH